MTPAPSDDPHDPERTTDATAWSSVLDSLSAQVDLQERCVRLGHVPPPDLEIDPPPVPLMGHDRLRALELFERCEALALDAARSLAATRRSFRSVYADGASAVATSTTSARS